MFVLEFENNENEDSKNQKSSKKSNSSKNEDDSQNHRNLKHVLGNILFNESSSSDDENKETSRCVPTYVVFSREVRSVFHEIISLEYHYNSCCKRISLASLSFMRLKYHLNHDKITLIVVAREFQSYLCISSLKSQEYQSSIYTTKKIIPTPTHTHRLSSKSILYACAVMFTTWIFASSVFYHSYLGMTYTQSLFFAVETGLSVGYGAKGIDCGGEAVCEALTSFHIMFVALLFAISLAAYASLVLVEKSKRLVKEERSRVMQEENQRRLKSIRGGRTDETIHCCSYLSSSTSSVIRYVFLYVFYIMLGIVYGVEIESWTFTKSLLFSTSAVATGGVVAPDRVDDVSMLLVTLYTIFGAFVFAFLITTVVDYIMEYMARRRIRSNGTLVLTPKDRKNLREDLFSGKSHVSYATFLEYTLLKTRAVSADALRRTRLAWNSINVDGDDRITIEEMYASQLFEMADRNGDGDLSRAEFSQLCELIVRRQGYDTQVQNEISRRLQREFMRLDENRSGRIEKHEFVRFVTRLETLLGDFVGGCSTSSSSTGFESSGSSSKIDDGRRSSRRIPFSIVQSHSTGMMRV